MRTTSPLQIGAEHSLTYVISADKTVPHLYPEAPEFQRLPPVFATGFVVGLAEWVCMQLLELHQNDPDDMSVGAHIDLWHCAPALPGETAIAKCRFLRVHDGMHVFKVTVHSGERLLAKGTHGRQCLSRTDFDTLLAAQSVIPKNASTPNELAT